MSNIPSWIVPGVKIVYQASGGPFSGGVAGQILITVQSVSATSITELVEATSTGGVEIAAGTVVVTPGDPSTWGDQFWVKPSVTSPPYDVESLGGGKYSFGANETYDGVAATGIQYSFNNGVQQEQSGIVYQNADGLILEMGDQFTNILAFGTGSYQLFFESSNIPASLSVSSDPNATRGQVIPLSSLVTISAPRNVGYQTLQLWDSDGTVAGGEFKINGVAQSAGHAINVPSGANVVFDVGTLGGTDTLRARLLEDNGTTTAWQTFTVTAPKATLPTLTVHNDASATPSEVISLDTLVTISDPSNVGYQALELEDTNGTVTGGQFVVNEVPQTGGHTINVSLANVADTVYDAGTSGGTDTLDARLLQDNGTLTAWQEFTVKEHLTIAAGATVEIPSAYSGPVTFAGSTGTLQLDNSSSFTGTVAGMSGQDKIDLRNISFSTLHPLTYTRTTSETTLHITDGTHTANIALLGNYLASTFVPSSDGHGGTDIVDPQPTSSNQHFLATPPQHA